MSSSKIPRMANQIATFFESQPENEQIDGIADHINSFWEPRMRRELFELIESGKGELHPLVLKASDRIRPVKAEEPIR